MMTGREKFYGKKFLERGKPNIRPLNRTQKCAGCLSSFENVLYNMCKIEKKRLASADESPIMLQQSIQPNKI